MLYIMLVRVHIVSLVRSLPTYIPVIFLTVDVVSIYHHRVCARLCVPSIVVLLTRLTCIFIRSVRDVPASRYSAFIQFLLLLCVIVKPIFPVTTDKLCEGS